MIDIQLINQPNQSLNIRLDNLLYKLTIKQAGNIMAMQIVRSGEVILDFERMVGNWPLIQYPYLENGNFILLTNIGDYPFYTEFGITQFLTFASQSEIDALIN